MTQLEAWTATVIIVAVLLLLPRSLFVGLFWLGSAVVLLAAVAFAVLA